jgi:hypothetical protein
MSANKYAVQRRVSIVEQKCPTQIRGRGWSSGGNLDPTSTLGVETPQTEIVGKGPPNRYRHCTSIVWLGSAYFQELARGQPLTSVEID